MYRSERFEVRGVAKEEGGGLSVKIAVYERGRRKGFMLFKYADGRSDVELDGRLAQTCYHAGETTEAP